MRRRLHEALDDAVFERVETDDGEAAAFVQMRDGERQHQRHFLKLPIEVNP